MPEKSKTLTELKADKAKLEKQSEQVRQQLVLLAGAISYIAGEIERLEKPAEEVKSDVS